MPANLDDLTPIEALYRARSYLRDYAMYLAELEGETGPSDVQKCVWQSAEQCETIAELMKIMEIMMGNKMPPVPKRSRQSK